MKLKPAYEQYAMIINLLYPCQSLITSEISHYALSLETRGGILMVSKAKRETKITAVLNEPFLNQFEPIADCSAQSWFNFETFNEIICFSTYREPLQSITEPPFGVLWFFSGEPDAQRTQITVLILFSLKANVLC